MARRQPAKFAYRCSAKEPTSELPQLCIVHRPRGLSTYGKIPQSEEDSIPRNLPRRGKAALTTCVCVNSVPQDIELPATGRCLFARDDLAEPRAPLNVMLHARPLPEPSCRPRSPRQAAVAPIAEVEFAESMLTAL